MANRSDTSQRRDDVEYNYHEWLSWFLTKQGYDIVGIWSSDTQSGTTDEDDYLGNHDGQLNGSPTLGASSVVDDGGSAFSFDGVDDESAVPTSSSLNIGSSESFTLLMWTFAPQSLFDNGLSPFVISKESTARYLIRVQSDGNVQMWAEDASGNGASKVTTSGSPFSQGVNLVGLQVDRSVDQVHPICNKTYGNIEDISTMGAVDPSDDLHFGERSGSYYEGKIGVRAIVKDAVSDSDLDKIYDVGIDRSNR